MRYMEEIDSSYGLYLAKIEEPEDNGLSLVVEEARPAGPGEDIEVGGVIIPNSREIVSDEGCSAWKISFNSYIAYSVRAESFTVLDPDEEFTGRLFCLYSKSKFIDYVREATIAKSVFPELTSRHYGINCLNHIVDVISFEEPEILKLR